MHYTLDAKNALKCEIILLCGETVAVQSGDRLCFACSQGRNVPLLDAKHTKQYRCRHTVDISYPYHLLTISFIHQMMVVSAPTYWSQAISRCATQHMKLKLALLYFEHDVCGLSVCKQQRNFWENKVESLVHSEPRVMFNYIFSCGLFNDISSSSAYIASNYRMISEKRIGKDVEGSSRDLI
jgi:hypothetical protein